MGGYISSPKLLTRKYPGPFEVGCADLMIDGSVLGDSGLFLRVFYPTEQEPDETPTRPLWLPKPQYAHGLGEYLGQSQQKMTFLTSTIVGDKRADCLENVQLAKSRDKWPVVVFSHGLGGSRSCYSTYCTSLASHGFVVAAVEHRDQSACWTYYTTEKNGQVVEHPVKIRIIDKSVKDEFKIRNQQVNKRVAECVKALNVLEQLNLGQVPEKVFMGQDFNWGQFKKKLSIETAAIIGHSFGGATALASTAYTTDFQKAVVLDGWMFPLDANQQEQANQPTMFLNIGDWQWEKNLEVVRKIYQHNNKNGVFTYDGGVHQCFSDFPFIFPHWMAKQFGVQGSTESTKCMEAAVDLTLEFLQYGNEAVQQKVNKNYSDFISNKIYGREKLLE